MTTPVVRTIRINDFGMEVVDNIQAVRDQAVHRLRVLLGEWLLNVLEGVPQELIHTTPITLGQVGTILTEEVRKIDHVEDVTVTLLTLDSDTREFRYGATILTDFGETTDIEVGV